MFGPPEKDACITLRVRRGVDFQIVEGRRGVSLETTLVIHDEDLASSTFSTCFRAETENIRRQLEASVTVRGTGTSAPGIIPFHGRNGPFANQKVQPPTEVVPLRFSQKSGEEFLPGVRHLRAWGIV